MTRSGKKIILIAAAALAVVVFAVTLSIYIWLPGYVESELIPRLAKASGLEAQEVRVRRIGFGGADLGPIKLKPAAKPALRIAVIQIDYSPWSLLRKRINGILISGVNATVDSTTEDIAKAEKSPRANQMPPAEPKSDLKLSELVPIELDYIKIEHCEILLVHGTHRMRFALTIDLDTTELSDGRLTGRMKVGLNGNQLNLSTHVDQPANVAKLELTGKDLDLQALPAMLRHSSQAQLNGMLDLTGGGEIQLRPLNIDRLSIRAGLRNLRVAASQLVIENPTAPDQTTQPVVISIDQSSPQHYRMQCSSLQIAAPFTTRVTGLTGQWSLVQDGWRLDAEGRTESPPQQVNPGLQIIDPMAVQWQVNAKGGPDRSVKFEVLADAIATPELLAGGLQSTHPDVTLNAEGNYTPETLTATVQMASKNALVRLPDGQAHIKGFTLTGSLAMESAASSSPYEVEVQTRLDHIAVKAGPTAAVIPAISITAAGRGDRNTPLRLQGQVRVEHGRIESEQHDIKISGISIRMPYQWPPVDAQPPGNIRVRQILWQDQPVGGLKGAIRQQKTGLAMTLDHASKLFPGLNVNMKGTLNRQGGSATIKMPPFQPATELDVGHFWPQGAGMRIQGRFEGSGVLNFNAKGLVGSAQLSVMKCNLSHETQEVTMGGIQIDLTMEDLLNLRSAPRQQLRIKDLQFGQIVADDLQMEFQIESPRGLFIERAAIKWCKGTVTAGALRIKSGRDQYDLTLFCDRLDLAMVLEQLGAAEASGDGAVNGRIPLRWADGALTFDQGFLFSTPGKSGRIRLGGTQALLAGLPPGTPQHTQLDIATEALKDYTYKWARLYLDSEEENLLIKLQFDGKPNRQLPFAYDTKLGSFKRVAGEGQADFTGISIDLNFNSPLNEILQYKKLLTPNQN